MWWSSVKGFGDRLGVGSIREDLKKIYSFLILVIGWLVILFIDLGKIGEGIGLGEESGN